MRFDRAMGEIFHFSVTLDIQTSSV